MALLLAIPAFAAMTVQYDGVNELDGTDDFCGTRVVNISFASTDLPNAENCTLRADGTIVGTTANTSANQITFPVSLATTGLTDGTFAFNATCYNATILGAVGNSSDDNVVVDNTAPTTTFGSDPADASTDTDGVFTITMTTNEKTLTTPTMKFGSNTITLSSSSDGLTHTKAFTANELVDGNYEYTVTVTDNATLCSNSRTSPPRTILVNTGGSSSVPMFGTGVSGGGSAVVVILLIAGVWFFFFRK